jgi:hypothetical protein
MVTVVLTVFSVASIEMYYSIKKRIKIVHICDENAWIRVFVDTPMLVMEVFEMASKSTAEERRDPCRRTRKERL